jgi:hypothetical protein
VPRSGREAEIDKEQATTVGLPESGHTAGNAHGARSPGRRKHAMGHSYTLRSRLGPTDAGEHK